MTKTQWSDKPKEKETKEDYLILRIFKANNWEGAYSETVMKKLSCSPDELLEEMKKLPMAKRCYYSSTYKGKVYCYVCGEVLAIDSRLKVVKRFKPDFMKYRPKRRIARLPSMRVKR